MTGFTAAGAALLARQMLSEDDPLLSVWRYCLIQLLDDYNGEASRVGSLQASHRFDPEPAPTGSAEVDAGLAALAEHLARRDGWPTPQWARKPGRYTNKWWFVTPLRGMHATALQQSPPSFRTRGVFITADALSRV
ncbi:hypothetical protein [Cryptosporangium sp. NPDC051539]|uniref:hypothetical protein n=1 Tax=Cryptosporangium sp. NPDC051539 TaxID=3363962 RepID=UPI0037B871DE